VSHVLNEGVDVPDARVAIILSGTGSSREYIQRLGRVLRRGDGDKQAILYEVVAEETTEEGVSRRRRAQTGQGRSPQLELLPPASPPVSPYEKFLQPTRKAAESSGSYPAEPQPDPDDDVW
jgi:superfamily II DNA or RNA helicase